MGLSVGTPNVADVTEELNFSFHFISPNLNLNSYMWLVATFLDSVDLNAKAPLSG